MSRDALDKFIKTLLALRSELDYAIENDGRPRSATVEIITDVEEAMDDVNSAFEMELVQPKRWPAKPVKH